MSYNASKWYTVSLTPDGLGTYTVSNATLSVTTQGGPEGFIYVPAGSPGFTVPTMLVSEFQSDVVSAIEVDANGDPKVSGSPNTFRTVFVEGLSGAEGATIDPLTGDFLFSTFGGNNRVLAVRGFALPPTTLAPTTTTSSTATTSTATATTTTTTTSTSATATSLTTTSTSRAITTTTATTTTLPNTCATNLPLTDLAGLECAIAGMHSTLGASPQPECTGPGRCQCNSRAALDHITKSLTNAKVAPTKPRCRRKLADALRFAGVMRRRIRQQAQRTCLAAGARRDTLLAEAAEIRDRSKAVHKGAYCSDH